MYSGHTAPMEELGHTHEAGKMRTLKYGINVPVRLLICRLIPGGMALILYNKLGRFLKIKSFNDNSHNILQTFPLFYNV